MISKRMVHRTSKTLHTLKNLEELHAFREVTCGFCKDNSKETLLVPPEGHILVNNMRLRLCTGTASGLPPRHVWENPELQSAPPKLPTGPLLFGNGPNTVSGSTVSNTELSEFFGAHWVPGSELSEFLSAYCLCVNANSPSFSQNSPSLP